MSVLLRQPHGFEGLASLLVEPVLDAARCEWSKPAVSSLTSIPSRPLHGPGGDHHVLAGSMTRPERR